MRARTSTPDDAKRVTMQVSTAGIVCNAALTVFKLVAGIVAHSSAMVADAVHSASDILGSLIVMIGAVFSHKAADASHPYGHEKLECIASILLGNILVLVGAAIGYAGVMKIIRGETLAAPGVLALIAAVIVIVLIRFFGTSLGLSIRATGDSLDMVSASSINPKATITIGLCLANALTALSGCLIGEYNKFCDINLGTGMVTIALASLIIGEVFAGHRGGVGKRIVCVVLGSIVYRFIIALALRLNISAEYFKLVSAVIVAVAIAAPNMKGYVRLAKIKSNARRLRALSGKGDETDA